MNKNIIALSVVIGMGISTSSMAANTCDALPDHDALDIALSAARSTDNGGFNHDMWGTIVDRAGNVCAVAKTGDPGDQWPGSRVISAQKANTANAFSLPDLALSTANLFSAVQPGGSLYGLQESNPVVAADAYAGDSDEWGTVNDALVGVKVGGVNVFGGGLALYNDAGDLVGAIGVSGDSSCADHNIAWKTRETLGFDNVPGGVHPTRGDDNIVYDINPTNPGRSGFESSTSESGWGHPTCSVDAQEIAANLTIAQ